MKNQIAVFCCLLLLGCASTGPASPEKGPAAASAGDAVAPEANGAVAAQGDNLSDQTEPEAGSQDALKTKTYSGDFSYIASMDLPLECDVNYTYAGKGILARMYINGGSEIRVESPAGVTQCRKTVTVIRGTRQYVGCEEKNIITSCDWFKSSYDPDRPGSASAFDFSSLPSSSISCRDWAYNASMFASSGTICDLG